MENNAYDASMAVWKGAGGKTVPLLLFDVWEAVRLEGSSIGDGLLGGGAMDALRSSFWVSAW